MVCSGFLLRHLGPELPLFPSPWGFVLSEFNFHMPEPQGHLFLPSSQMDTQGSSTKGEAPGSDVHAREPQMPQWWGQSQANPRLQLQLQLRLVQQLLVQVTGLVHFQSVQLGPQLQQLPCQLPVLSTHLLL